MILSVLFLPVFDMDEQKKIDKNVDGQLEKLLADLKEQKHYILKASLKIKDNCIGCGICATVCPRDILTIENGKAIRTQTTCEFCLSCVNNCPEKAIGFTSNEKNPDARYRNENITLQEIIKANNQQ